MYNHYSIPIKPMHYLISIVIKRNLIFKKNIFESYQFKISFSFAVCNYMAFSASWFFTFGKHALKKVDYQRNKRTTGNTNYLDEQTADGSLLTQTDKAACCMSSGSS